MSQIIGLPRFRRVKKGDPIRHEDFNALVDAVERMSQSLAAVQKQWIGSRLVFGEMAENLEDREIDKKLLPLFYNRGASSIDDKFSLNEEGEKGLVCDPQDGIYLEGERHAFLWLGGASKFIPLPGVSWHLARLDATLSPGGSALCTIFKWSDDSASFVSSGVSHTCYDFLLATGKTLETNRRIIIMQHPQSRKYIVTQAGCSTTEL